MAEFDSEDVRRMLEALRPEWHLREWRRIEEGTDFVAVVTCETPERKREAVLKARSFVDSAEFRPEPRLLELVGERTDLPVPEVLAVHEARDAGSNDSAGGRDEGDDPPPCFLMEYREGEQVDGPDDLAEGALDRLARETGENLAALHDIADWGGFGYVRCAEDAEIAGPGGLGVGSVHDSWPALLRERIEGGFDRIEDRFADLEGDLRDALDRRLRKIPERPRAAFVHEDYRYGNLLIDPETGATRAALDWGNHTTGDPAFDLVETENFLSGWAPLDSERRERVGKRLREGYRTRRDLDSDPARRACYHLVTRLGPLAWFDLWYGDADDPASIEEKHREAVASLV